MRIHPLAAVLLLLACDPTAPMYDLAVTLTATPASFRAGESVAIEVTVVNHGWRTRYMDSCLNLRPYIILSGDNDVVDYGLLFCSWRPDESGWFELPPGERHVFSTTWNGSAPGDGRSPPVCDACSEGSTLPPGQYFVRGRIAIIEGAVRSDPVPVEILP